ncbi:MAG TPA: AAA family ATPase [Planctomycetota bacterium]|nr:AAA family ATPase [Planctomycetota bacterium]
MQFEKATKKKSRARVALIGPSGSGKTYTALRVALGIGGKIGVIDTEHGSASKYVGTKVDEGVMEFDTLNLDSFSPDTYVDAIAAGERAGYDVLVIDSLTHAWSGKDGALAQVDRARGGNKFAAWGTVTPKHIAMIEAMLGSRCHIIATMRSKMEYVQEKDERTGKTTIRKVGMAPVQRDGMEYEFDVVGDLDQEHVLLVTKSRCPALDGVSVVKPGGDFAAQLVAWLEDGTDPDDEPHWTDPKEEPAEPPTHPPITDKQKTKIAILRKESGIPEDKYRAFLQAAFGVDSCTVLDINQASKLIERLSKEAAGATG